MSELTPNRKAPAMLTPPTASKKMPPRLDQIDPILRGSIYLDALEQLADQEVLSDSVLPRTRQRGSVLKQKP